jgi:hypothetical protein
VHFKTKRVSVSQLEEGDANLAQVLNNLVHSSSIGEHAKQMLKLPPLPYNDAIATFVLHELSVKPGRDLLVGWCCATWWSQKLDDKK